ncbi:hypothetical protein BXZ70DRAFT_309316 [Cristinia sonorae]|uniref:Uncharacterized protein n=1 Tax=Cristinia sonorae TaxID=1940300 RepID=A0A8K0UKU7_9AGAR|nr:hypothetical protein BXZ70DRAFT_309316 [Cristinia sonorae]
MLGYFAFPPSPAKLPPSSTTRIPLTPTLNASAYPTSPPEPSTSSPEDNSDVSDQIRKEQAWAERCRRDAQLHEARLARERAEAWQGELEWVRSGGVVRDARGRRDMARTELLRAEIRLQDEEKRILDKWNGYETRWRMLVLSTADSEKSVGWEDIPWPVDPQPASVGEITPEAVETFIFAPLRVRGSTSSRKEKLRSSILKWHPDKVAVILSRVVGNQQAAVREGVNTVFRILKELQDVDKSSNL